MPVLLIVIQVVFSSVDLGLTYSRTMIVLGVSLGLMAYLGDAARAQELDAPARAEELKAA